jgi:hypothetical protein
MLILVTILAALCSLLALSVALRHGTREVRLSRAIRVAAPPEVLLDLVGRLDRMAEWYVQPGLLPRPLRPATLAPWGESVTSGERLSRDNRETVQTRLIPAREFGYRRSSPGMLRYESVFRVLQCHGAEETQLQWEIHYQLLRPIDALLNLWETPYAVTENIESSLSAIRSLAESAAVKPSWHRSQPLAS